MVFFLSRTGLTSVMSDGAGRTLPGIRRGWRDRAQSYAAPRVSVVAEARAIPNRIVKAKGVTVFISCERDDGKVQRGRYAGLHTGKDSTGGEIWFGVYFQTVQELVGFEQLE